MSELLPILMDIKDDVGQVKAKVETMTEALPALFARVGRLEKSHSRLRGYGAGIAATLTAAGAYLKWHT